MSIYTRGEPASNQQFREATQRNAGRMENICCIPARCRCVCCGKARTEATGEHTKRGFVCHGCGRS